MSGASNNFEELVRIMAVLRAPDGCPWDREQTHMTLRRNLIEEAYEAVAAIESADDAELRDELGDILLQVVFHAQIASETGALRHRRRRGSDRRQAREAAPAHLR